jgi:ribosome-associated toxin RatA of RatAB toxin-antitoxin module
MRANVLLSVTLISLSGIACSAELRDVVVEREDNHYELRSEALFDVSPESLYDVLSNYDLFTKFTSAIVESRNVEADEEGRPRFYSRMEGCVMLWCKSFIRNGHLLLKPKTEIIAISNPDESDFTLSKERWELVPEGEGTVLIYEFEMEPDFWVPPVIGPYLIMRALRAGAERAINRIEALAVAIPAEQ